MWHSWLGEDCFDLVVNMTVQTTTTRWCNDRRSGHLMIQLVFTKVWFLVGILGEKVVGRVQVRMLAIREEVAYNSNTINSF